MPSYSVIRLSLSPWNIGVSNPKSQKISVGGIDSHLFNSTHIRVSYGFSNVILDSPLYSLPLVLNTFSQLHKNDLLLYDQELITCLIYADV